MQEPPATTINEETSSRHRRKYESKNPLQRLLLGRFHREVRGLIDSVAPRAVLDFGCGEAFFWKEMAALGPLPKVVGLDLREDAIEEARRTFPDLDFRVADLFEFRSDREFDLVVAVEVLEHLYEPGKFLRRLCQLATGRVLLTVPHEPFFRVSNLLRGRDVRRLGNHPEHVQNWSKGAFVRFASEYLNIEHVSTPFPFIVVLGTPRMKSRDA